ncbi:MAG: clostripain-related cysteine peptidase [Prevotellaceae bacterium]|nr:clostripain-related cysteine peptidase [Prevotellaceae bacterium]
MKQIKISRLAVWSFGRIGLSLALMLALTLTLCSCDSDSGDDEPTISRRTICAYMISETLEDPILRNVQMMVTGSTSINRDDVLLVYLDRPRKNSILMRIKEGRKDTLQVYDSDLHSTDPVVMNRVIKWCFDKYPSQSYVIVFASHGSWWLVRNDSVAVTRTPKTSYAYDNNGETINIPSLKYALSGLPKLDFIMWDCCNMQCVEVAYELKDVTTCLIGSPAEIPSAGGAYNTLLPVMFSNKSTYREDIVEEYVRNYETQGGDSLPFSLIYTQHIDNLARVTAEKLHLFMPEAPLDLKLNGHIFYFRDNKRMGDAVMYDMNNVMLTQIAQGDTANADYKEWKQALDMVVTLKKRGTHWNSSTLKYDDFYSFYKYMSSDKYYGGVSMFFPSSSYKYSSWDYNKDMHQLGWYYAVRWADFGW